MSQTDLPIPLHEAATAAAATSYRRSRPLAQAFGIVYLTAAAVLLLDPQPVLDWLDDLDPSPLVTVARSGVGVVAAASHALGLSWLSEAVRLRTAPLLKRSETPQS